MIQRILLVEDSNMMTLLLKMALEQEGFEILTASSGNEGVRVAKEKRPNLIVLDLVMPDMDGFAVFQSILSDADIAQIPVVFFSNFSTQKDQEKARQMGAADFLVKAGIPPDELVGRIRSILEGTRFSPNPPRDRGVG